MINSILSILGSTQELADIRKEEGILIIEYPDGTTESKNPENWEVDVRGDRLVFHSKLARTGKQTHNPPKNLYIPVSQMTAADNVYEKSEQNSRIKKSINRSSKVVNETNFPNYNPDIDSPYIEMWTNLIYSEDNYCHFYSDPI